MLGQGTFGQVAKCWDAETNNYVAVKVIKNQPAFYQQAIMEVSLLSLVRYFNVHSSIYFCWMHGKIWLSTVTIISPAVKQEIWSWWSTPHCPNAGFFPLPKSFVYSLWDAWSQPVRWLSFNYVHQSSVFHSWSDINLHFYRYELLKRNSLRGLQMKYVRTFSRQVCCHLNMLNGSLMYLLQYVMCILSFQILDALIVMKDAGIIHCDLKPENILIAPTWVASYQYHVLVSINPVAWWLRDDFCSVKTAAGVKVIDFGSACMEGKTIYSYIQVLFELTQQFKFWALVLFFYFKSSLYHFLFQSRYYRSPEVLLGYPYPMWHLQSDAFSIFTQASHDAQIVLFL